MSLLCIGLTWHRAVESGGAPFSSLSASEFARRLRRAFARGTSLRDAPFTPVATAHGPVARGRRDPRGHVRRRRRLSAVRGAHRTVGKQPISASGAPPRRSSGGDGSFPPIVRITDRRCHDLTTISPAHPTRVALHAAHRTVNRAAADVRKAARAVPSPPRPLYLPPDPASDHRGHPHARTPHDRPHPGRSLGHGSPARHPSPSAFPRWFAMPAAPARPPTPRTRPRPHDSIRHEWTGKARTRRCDSNCSGH